MAGVYWGIASTRRVRDISVTGLLVEDDQVTRQATGHLLSWETADLQALGLVGWLLKPPDLISLSNLLAQALAPWCSLTTAPPQPTIYLEYFAVQYPHLSD